MAVNSPHHQQDTLQARPEILVSERAYVARMVDALGIPAISYVAVGDVAMALRGLRYLDGLSDAHVGRFPTIELVCDKGYLLDYFDTHRSAGIFRAGRPEAPIWATVVPKDDPLYGKCGARIETISFLDTADAASYSLDFPTLWGKADFIYDVPVIELAPLRRLNRLINSRERNIDNRLIAYHETTRLGRVVRRLLPL